MAKAAILGASGLVGSYLVHLLCEAEQIESVVSLARRPLEFTHPKLKERLGDLLEEDYWNYELDVDMVFVCIGTTQAKTSNKDLYRAIDYGIPKSACEWAKTNNAELISVVSSMGAKSSSNNFYLKTKGEIEDYLKDQSLAAQIFRPSLILGPRKEQRFGESFGKFFMKLLKPISPKNYRPVEAELIAKAMLNSALASSESKLVLSGEMEALAKS